MTPDYRSVLRKYDELLKQGELVSANEVVFQAIKEFDTDREYTNSINLLERMLTNNNSEIFKTKLISHIILRSMISGDSLKYNEYKDKILRSEQTAMSRIILNILEKKEASEKFEYMLDGIEKQTIFGNFKQIEDIPMLEFENEDSVYNTIEDYFNYGKYVVNLIQINSNFHHSITVDIGESIDLTITEKRRIMKLDD